jgi:prefoldin subunit 5
VELQVTDETTFTERRNGGDRRVMTDRRSDETARELAAHTVEIKHLQQEVDKIADDVDDIKNTLHTISATLSEAKGGWRTIVAVGGALGVIASVVPWVVDSVHK